MLSKNQVVAARRAIELQYGGVCTVLERQAVVDDVTKITSHVDVIVLEAAPCKLSYGKLQSATESATVAIVSQSITVFIAPEIAIKAGSKLVITQNGITRIYESSGEPSVFPTHQEIALVLAKGKA